MPRKRAEDEPSNRDPFSPREVGRITREFYAMVHATCGAAGQYNSSKLGHQFELRYNPKKKLVWWRLCLDRTWVEGEDTGVWQALRSIGTKISNKAYDKRLNRMAEIEIANSVVRA